MKYLPDYHFLPPTKQIVWKWYGKGGRLKYDQNKKEVTTFYGKLEKVVSSVDWYLLIFILCYLIFINYRGFIGNTIKI